MTSPKWRSLLAIRAWAITFASVSAVLLFGGYFYYRMEAQRIQATEYKSLATIAGMKCEQIHNWRKERIADAVRSGTGPMLIKNTKALINGSKDPLINEELRQVMDANRRRGGYVHISVIVKGLDGKAASILEEQSGPEEEASEQLVAAVFAKSEPMLGDFYWTSDGKICIDAAAPIRDSAGKTLGVVIQRSDASAALFPLIQSWPTASRSAETLLVRREGSRLVFLNELRHRSGAALSLRMPLNKEDLPAVQAVLRRTGLFRGIDYRGEEVLADLRPVPDSPWFMVTKVDTDEILSEARYRAYSTSIIVAIAITLAGVLVAYAYRRRQASVYQALFETERQKRLDREQFRTTLYSIGDGIITTDTESRVREMNRVAESMTGWTENEARGQLLEDVFKIINQDTRAKVLNPVGIVLREGIIVGLANHTLLIARDGTERAIADSAAPIRDERGNVSGVVLVFSDVSEKYRVEAALKKSEQDYRMLFESMIDGFAMHELITDAEGKPADYRFISVNPAFERITGIPAKKVVGHTVLEVMPTTDPIWIERYGRVAQTGEPAYFEEYSTALGRYFDVAAFSLKQGQFAAVFADITQRKMAEMRLRESEVRFRSLLKSVSSVAVLSFDLDFNVRYWNKAAETLYGYTAKEALGRNLTDLIFTPEAFRMIEKFDFKRIADESGQIPSQEVTFKRKDGTPVTVISSPTVVKTPDRPCEFFCFDIDITERKRLEAQILRTQRMESIGTLASGVAHDLNNILAPIILSADLLRNESCEEGRTALIETIETCAQRGANVVNQVITFARGAKGEKTTLQLRHLIHEMEKIVRDTFPKNINIASHVASDLWPVVGNPTQIHQVLLNLCVNARDAMPNGGTLAFRAWNESLDESKAAQIPEAKPGCFAAIEISDTGTGIAAEIIGKVFDPFFTTKDVGKGTGLGLSTVSGIVRGHGGCITVSSELDRGAKFTVYLPADLRGGLETSNGVPERRKGAGETILVVDDDRPLCRTIASVLQINGYKVLSAADASEALLIFQNHASEITLVLTDMSMPGMDGGELIAELQKTVPGLKIIASSGQATEESQERLRGCGVNTLLHKPYDVAKLLAAIASALKA